MKYSLKTSALEGEVMLYYIIGFVGCMICVRGAIQNFSKFVNRAQTRGSTSMCH